MDVLEHLFTHPRHEAIGDISAWLDHLDACPFDDSIDRALWAGFEADRLGYAFAGGYQAALARLFGTRRASFAATEAGGGHPRAITTTLAAGRLVGEKTFATLASVAETLLVVAKVSEDGPRNKLVVVRLPARAEGVVVRDRLPTPFTPEIPHARVTVDVAVAADDVLEGDGYDRWLKPFRTVEDTHVLAAVLGHLLRTARTNRFAPAFTEDALAIVLALHPSTTSQHHLALAGLFRALERLLGEHEPEWSKTDEATRTRWQRDLPLLAVAASVRQKRTEAAWRALS